MLLIWISLPIESFQNHELCIIHAVQSCFFSTEPHVVAAELEPVFLHLMFLADLLRVPDAVSPAVTIMALRSVLTSVVTCVHVHVHVHTHIVKENNNKNIIISIMVGISYD